MDAQKNHKITRIWLQHARDEYSEKERRNRIVCYADEETKIDHASLVDMQINGNGYEIGIVSFKNECILSVYDDRGCDIVFATPEKMKEFFAQLKPYFLLYDYDEMEKRFNNWVTPRQFCLSGG